MKDKNDQAVSAVIGVVLMVAITVAISATVYFYAGGIMETSSTVKSTVNIQFLKDNADDFKLTVSNSYPPDIKWSDLNISASDGNGIWNAGAGNDITGSSFNWSSDIVTAGDSIYIDNGTTTTITIRYDPANTLIGTWTFQ